MQRIFKVLFWCVTAVNVLTAVRLAQVQYVIQNRDLQLSDYSESGYTPENVFGHGNLRVNGGDVSWVIYDEPASQNGIRKVCAKGIVPVKSADVDFIYFEDQWFKLRSGTFIIDENEGYSDPKSFVFKGFIQSPSSFPVRRPGFFYKLKILKDKLLRGALSPSEYVETLSLTNSTCHDIPLP